MKNGPYEMIVPPDDYPGKWYRERYAYEHSVVYWQATGKLVPEGWNIHHIDGNKRNNDPANLELVNNKEHSRHHAKTRPRDINGTWL